MREFNLEEAEYGKDVCTRNGLDAKITSFDNLGDYPINAIIEYPNRNTCLGFNNEGQYVNGIESKYDLMMKE